MEIAQPYARMMDVYSPEDGVKLLRKIEWIGRISHRSEDAFTEDSWKRFIPAIVIGKGDWSIVEHASATVDFMVDRGITHEIVRHRLASYTQESTRFVNYEKKMPPRFVDPGLSNEVARALNGEQSELSADQLWKHAVETSEDVYRQLIQKGVAPQLARSVFPNALGARLIMTCNLRNWRHFLIMRTTREAHPQMRQVTIPLLHEFKEKVPILFDDIEPMARQADAIKLGK